jgi:hypothetical protein
MYIHFQLKHSSELRSNNYELSFGHTYIRIALLICLIKFLNVQFKRKKSKDISKEENKRKFS